MFQQCKTIIIDQGISVYSLDYVLYSTEGRREKHSNLFAFLTDIHY